MVDGRPGTGCRTYSGRVAGAICLQGGREFTSDCREMDEFVLAVVDDGPVAILAGAARVGSDYAGASERARRHYDGLGAEVVIVPDPRTDPTGAIAALTDDLALVVLPGGSPSSLVAVLLGATEQVGDRLLDLHAAGAGISGASAGAMVLCDYTVLPDQRTRRRTTVTHGLALVEGLALPHWEPGPLRWPLPDEVALWGLPECGGVVITDDGTTEAVGHGIPSFRPPGGDWVPVVRSR